VFYELSTLHLCGGSDAQVCSEVKLSARDPFNDQHGAGAGGTTQLVCCFGAIWARNRAERLGPAHRFILGSLHQTSKIARLGLLRKTCRHPEAKCNTFLQHEMQAFQQSGGSLQKRSFAQR
jgi:hypothetical protein